MKSKKFTMAKCCVLSCTNHYNKNNPLSFFQIRNDNQMRWKIINEHPELFNIAPEQARICAVHFEERFFKNYAKNRLYNDAVPTLFLYNTDHSYNKPNPKVKKEEVENNDASDEIDMYYNVPKKVEIACQTPAKWAMKRKRRKTLVKTKIVYVRPEKITDDEFYKFCETNFDEPMSEFMKVQLHTIRKHPAGFRYTKRFKEFAAAIYLLGPKVYENLSRLFKLPSKKALYAYKRECRKGEILEGESSAPKDEDILELIEACATGNKDSCSNNDNKVMEKESS